MGLLDRQEISISRYSKRNFSIVPHAIGAYLFRTFHYAALIAISAFMALPLVWMILSSFKTQAEIESVELAFFPLTWHVNNYGEMTKIFNVGLYYTNSLIVAILSVIFVVMISAWIGFIFAKFRFKGSQYLFVLILATMMIPGTVTVIPLYLITLRFDMVDTIWGLIVPGIVSPFGIYLLRQFIQSIPDDLIDAARVDGCSDFLTFFTIILPLVKPALSALAIFVFIGSWDSFLWPLIVLNSETWKTLPLGLALFAQENYTLTHLSMAGATLSVVPVLIVYFVFQKQFVRGVTMTGLAGI